MLGKGLEQISHLKFVLWENALLVQRCMHYKQE
jgi:hypothetical protein